MQQQHQKEKEIFLLPWVVWLDIYIVSSCRGNNMSEYFICTLIEF